MIAGRKEVSDLLAVFGLPEQPWGQIIYRLFLYKSNKFLAIAAFGLSAGKGVGCRFHGIGQAIMKGEERIADCLPLS
jgi:hypothetical protein